MNEERLNLLYPLERSLDGYIVAAQERAMQICKIGNIKWN